MWVTKTLYPSAAAPAPPVMFQSQVWPRKSKTQLTAGLNAGKVDCGCFSLGSRACCRGSAPPTWTSPRWCWWRRRCWWRKTLRTGVLCCCSAFRAVLDGEEFRPGPIRVRGKAGTPPPSSSAASSGSFPVLMLMLTEPEPCQRSSQGRHRRHANQIACQSPPE